MGWLILIILSVVLLGPMRKWFGRHWAFLLSVTAGAAGGFVLGTILMRFGPLPPFTPLLTALIWAIAAGRSGPGWLRNIEKDGRNGNDPRRR